MSESVTFYCIVCGREFRPAASDVVICHACGGPPEAAAPPRSAEPAAISVPPPETPAVSPRAFATEADVPDEWQVNDNILDLYEVKHIFRTGGMGLVYRVHHRKWNLDLAVKSPRASLFQTEDQKKDFVGEAEAWMDLGLHPHIVTCYYVRTLGGIPRVFAEFVEGGSLKDWIRDRRLYAGGEREALRRILDVAIQFAWGLGYAHEKGMVHQDVKPANALMMPDGTLKVTDFGLVRAKGRASPAYVAPEQDLRLGRQIDRRTDIWGWGVSVLEMFTGGATWSDGSIAAYVLDEYLSAPPADLPRMPQGVADLLRDCFQNDPALRPPSMDAVADRLMAVYEQELGEPYPREKPNPLDLRADSLNNRAVSYLDLGREEEAVRFWQEALQVDPAHLEANFNYGYYRWQRGEIPGSRFLEEFLALKGKHQSRAEYWSMLGWIYIEQGNLEEAQNLLERIQDEQFLAMLAQGKYPNIKQKMQIGGHGPVSFSPDNEYIIFQECHDSDAYTAALLNLHTGDKKAPLYRGVVWSVAFSPKGNGVVFGDKRGILWWDMGTKGISRLLGKDLRRWKGLTSVKAVVFTPDGGNLITGHEDGTIRVWDISNPMSPREIRQWNVGGIVPGVDTLDIDPTGKYLVSGGYDNFIRLWDLNTGREIRRMTIDDPISVRYLPSGNLAISGNGDSTLCLWNLENGQDVLRFYGHTGYVTSVDISPDGRFAISGSADKTARLWDLRTGREIRCLPNHGGQITSVRFAPDSSKALTCGGGFVYIWEISYPEDWRGIAVYPVLCRSERYVELEQRRAQAAILLKNAQVRLDNGEYHKSYDLLRSVQTIPDYEREISILELLAVCGQRGIRTGLREGWCFHTLEGHSESINAVSISPDGKYVLSGSEDKTVRVWDIKDGREIFCLKGHRSGIGYALVSRKAALALSACGNMLIVWDISKGKEIARLVGGGDLQPFSGIQFASFSPQGHLALVQSGDPFSGTRYAYIWNIAENTVTRLRWLPRNVAYQQPEQGIFSADEHYIISVNNTNTLSLWDLSAISIGYGGDRVIRETYSLGDSFRQEKIQGRITCFNISSDGQLAVFGSHDDGEGNEEFPLTIWRLEEGREICRLYGHRGIIRTVIFSPDGRFLASGDDDRKVRIWDLTLQQEIYCLEGHTHRVSSLAISDNGNYLISGSWDKTIRVWALDWDYEFPDPADWDEGARPYLDIFLTLHTPYGRDGLSRVGAPQWTEEDFQKLLRDLGLRGYGWLRPEGVRRELEKMARERGWKGG